MKLKLAKVLLSDKPSPQSVLLGVISLAVLVLIHGVNSEQLIASGKLVYEDHQYWRALTTSLVHADMNHLGHNLLFFTGLSILLNHYFGWFIYPFLSLLIGGVINLIALKIYPPDVHLVGISGVIYFMAGFWLILYIFIERRFTLTRRIINSTAIGLIFLFPEVFQTRVSYLAHGLGLGFGLILGLCYFYFQKEAIRAHEKWIEVPPDPDIILIEDFSVDENNQV